MRFLSLFMIFCASTGVAQNITVDSTELIEPKKLQEVLSALRDADRRLERLKVHDFGSFLDAHERLVTQLERKGSTEFLSTSQELNERMVNLQRILDGKFESGVNMGHYLSALDSLQSGMGLLKMIAGIDGSPALADYAKITTDISNTIAGLQQKWNLQKIIETEIQQYAEQVRIRLRSSGLAKEMDNLNRAFARYRKGMAEVQDVIQDPKKLKAIALRKIYSLPLYTRYFAKYSELSSLFMLPGEDLNPIKLEGLQTRATIDKILQENGSGIQDPRTLMKQSVSDLQSIMGKMKAYTENGSLGADESRFSGNSSVPMSKRGKKFEFGLTFQASRPGFNFPKIADIGIQVAYLPKGNLRTGIGLVYRIGLGQSWKNITVSHEGLGARIFTDFKLASFGLWLTGGAELNYNQSFKTWPSIKGNMLWQKAAVIGLTKDYRIGPKAKGKVQLLFDALYASHLPQTQPLLFRIGYQFK